MDTHEAQIKAASKTAITFADLYNEAAEAQPVEHDVLQRIDELMADYRVGADFELVCTTFDKMSVIDQTLVIDILLGAS